MRIEFSELPAATERDALLKKYEPLTVSKGQSSGAANGLKVDITSLESDLNMYGFQGKKLKAGKIGQENSLEKSLRKASSGVFDEKAYKNYMAVMSNTMSNKDFMALQDEGWKISSMSAEQAVTNLDRIKVTLARAGVNVAGYTDTVDKDTLEAIAGGAAAAAGVAGEISANSAPQKQDIVVNLSDSEMEPALPHFNRISEEIAQNTMSPEEGMSSPISQGLEKETLTIEPKLSLERFSKVDNQPALSDNPTAYKQEAADGEHEEFSDAIVPATRQDKSFDAALKLSNKLPDDFLKIPDSLTDYDLPDTEKNVKRVQEALSLAHSIQPLSEETMEYLCINELEPTIRNVYEAQYSSAHRNPAKIGKAAYFSDWESGYIGTKGGTEEIMSLDKDINRVIREAGLDPEEEIKRDAVKLIERGIPLEPRTLGFYEDLKHLEFPLKDEELFPEIAAAIQEAKEPEQAYIIKGYRALQRARNLSETRLKMMGEANRELIKSGYAIDTNDLEAEVRDLRSKERLFFRAFFGGEGVSEEEIETRSNLFDRTVSTVKEIRTMPASLIGSFISAEDFTINEVYEAGLSERAKYEAAGRSYEAVGTEVRRDLGDSIYKAFQNIDDILDDMALEKSLDNERAVRILGYNSIEINHDNIEHIKSLDLELSTLLDKLNGAAAAKLIKSGINPLNMPIDELIEKIDSLSGGETDEEHYAKYLLKLEREGSFTEKESQSYIGVFRLLRAIERSDGAVLGSLMETGRTLTLSNLLGELRNSKKKDKFDLEIGNQEGRVESREDPQHLKIDAQIETAFNNDYLRREFSEAYRNLSPEKLHNAGITEDSTLRDLINLPKGRDDDGTDSGINKQLYKEELESIERAAESDRAIYRLLRAAKVELSASNINACHELLFSRGEMMKSIFKLKDERKEEERLKGKAERLAELFGEGEEEAEEAYEDFIEDAQTLLRDELFNADKYIDIRALQSINRQLYVAKAFSAVESYELPIVTDGFVTSMNLRIVHNGGRSSLAISMETAEAGRLQARFNVDEGKLNGIIISDSVDFHETWKDAQSDFESRINREGLLLGTVNFAENKALNINNLDSVGDESESTVQKTKTAELYKCARAFIGTMRQILK